MMSAREADCCTATIFYLNIAGPVLRKVILNNLWTLGGNIKDRKVANGY